MVDTEKLKASIKITNLAESLGIELRGNKTNCLWHQEKTPSLSFDNEKGMYKCFGCGESGDIFTLYQKVKNVDFKEALEALGGTEIKQTPMETKHHPDPELYEGFIEHLYAQGRGEMVETFLKDRGFTEETLNRYMIAGIKDLLVTKKFLEETYGKKRLINAGLVGRGGFVFSNHPVILPVVAGGRIVAVRGRNLTGSAPKYLQAVGIPLPIWNADEVGDTVYLTEGEFDAMALSQLGVVAYGICGTNGFKDEFLKHFENKDVILAFDNDDAGKKATKDIAEKLKETANTISTIDIPVEMKDMNECMSAGINPISFPKTVLKDGIRIMHIADIAEQQKKEQSMEKMPTGFTLLDTVFQGGLTPGNAVIVAAPSGEGKCHGKGTKILMYDGKIKNVEDIVVGDILMGDDSTPRNVISLARGEEMMYKICHPKGRTDSYTVNESHILSLYGNGKRKDIPLVDFLKKSNSFRKSHFGYKAPVSFKSKVVKIDPYFVGLWLGDGTSANSGITTMDKEIVDYLYLLANEKGLGVTVRPQEGNKSSVYSITRKKDKSPIEDYRKRKIGGFGDIQSMVSLLREYGLIGNKHIPYSYLVNSRKNRLRLLAGIIDSDGYVNHNGYEVVQKNESLASDIVYLCRSLGFWSNYTVQKNKKYNVDYFRVKIYGNNLMDVPVLLERKKIKESKKLKNSLHYSINIEKIGVGEYFGFVLDGNHRYLLGDFTVTHNTAFMQTVSYHYAKSGVTSLWLSYEETMAEIWNRFEEMGAGKDLQLFAPFDHEDNKISFIEKVIERQKKKTPFFVCFIDQLSNLAPKVDDKTEIKHISSNFALYLGRMSTQIKELAMKHRIIIFTAHQLGRTGELAYSDMVRHAPDKVLYLEREKAPTGARDQFTDKTYLKVNKNRPYGTRPVINMTVFDGKFMEYFPTQTGAEYTESRRIINPALVKEKKRY